MNNTKKPIPFEKWVLKSALDHMPTPTEQKIAGRIEQSVKRK
jgi:hypothetical protein